MKKLKTILIALIMMMASGCMFSQDITGKWSGTLSINQSVLKIYFNISAADDGYTSTFDSPDQGEFGTPTDSTIYKKPDLRIVIAELSAEYEGKLTEENKFEGTYTQLGHELELVLTKMKE